jgi:hypothetical protein
VPLRRLVGRARLSNSAESGSAVDELRRVQKKYFQCSRLVTVRTLSPYFGKREQDCG